MLDIDLNLGKYIGRTSYGNVVALEVGILGSCNIPMEPCNLTTGLVMTVPMEGEAIIDGRLGNCQESASITVPEIFKIIDPERAIRIGFKGAGKNQSPELFASPAHPEIISAANSVLAIKQESKNPPLDFRVAVSKALVIVK